MMMNSLLVNSELCVSVTKCESGADSTHQARGATPEPVKTSIIMSGINLWGLTDTPAFMTVGQPSLASAVNQQTFGDFETPFCAVRTPPPPSPRKVQKKWRLPSGAAAAAAGRGDKYRSLVVSRQEVKLK